MSYVYSDPSRENDPHALPDVEVFFSPLDDDKDQPESGWYWQACQPGCLPDGDACGPFGTEAEAVADAQANEWEAGAR